MSRSLKPTFLCSLYLLMFPTMPSSLRINEFLICKKKYVKDCFLRCHHHMNFLGKKKKSVFSSTFSNVWICSTVQEITTYLSLHIIIRVHCFGLIFLLRKIIENVWYKKNLDNKYRMSTLQKSKPFYKKNYVKPCLKHFNINRPLNILN